MLPRRLVTEAPLAACAAADGSTPNLVCVLIRAWLLALPAKQPGTSPGCLNSQPIAI
jgi:hypothetical protein